jgi:hypothetical protein
MQLPGLPLQQYNEFVPGELCGWWAIGSECVRTGKYPLRTRNLAKKVMTDIAEHMRQNVDEDMFAKVWLAWKSSKQVETTLHDYIETLRNKRDLRVGNGCSDADVMMAAHWLGHMKRPADGEPFRLFTYREGDNGYKRYSMGQVHTNIAAADVDHERDIMLCNNAGVHWSPTRVIRDMVD